VVRVEKETAPLIWLGEPLHGLLGCKRIEVELINHFLGRRQVKNPFVKATEENRRLKVFLWGEPGCGKTTLALQFPSPAVIDLEGGTDHYSDRSDFFRLATSSATEAVESIDWLLTEPHEYRTLIIDPITVLWESVQAYWNEVFLKRNKAKRNFRHEFISWDFQDWATCKANWKEILRKLMALDMHVVAVARQKLLYPEEGKGGSPVAVPDAEKSLPYYFDVELHLERLAEKYTATVRKDRTNKLPPGFDTDFSVIATTFGLDRLNRKAEPAKLASTEQVKQIMDLVKSLNITEEVYRERLDAYGAQDTKELSEQNASIIINRLKAKETK